MQERVLRKLRTAPTEPPGAASALQPGALRNIATGEAAAGFVAPGGVRGRHNTGRKEACEHIEMAMDAG